MDLEMVQKVFLNENGQCDHNLFCIWDSRFIKQTSRALFLSFSIVRGMIGAVTMAAVWKRKMKRTSR